MGRQNMAVSFAKNQDEIIKAWRDVVDTPDKPKWALFGYEGTTNNIKLISTGTQGLSELVQEFNCSLIQYAFCRVLDQELGINKLVLINWQGDSSPLSRKGLCASHVGDVSNYFKGCTQTITIRNDDEATKDYLMDQIMKTAASKISLSKNQLNRSVENEAGPVGSTYKKTDISTDITSNRKSFWQQQEEEEKLRLAEEKKRAAEKQAQFERERKLREDSEAIKLAEKTRERDRLIEATRQAVRKDSSSNSVGSQPNSMMSNSNDEVDDDSRVGRRSELIRLERNQETQSLISKGLIKNKRAIFEQAQQQQQQQTIQPSTLMRRASGAMITQRLNTFKSLDSSSSLNANTNDGSSNTVEKLANGLAKHVNVNEDRSATTNITTVNRNFEPVTLNKEDGEVSSSTTASFVEQPISDVNNTKSATSPIKPNQEKVAQADDKVDVPSEINNGKVADISQDVNGNTKPIAEEETNAPVVAGGDQVVSNGKHDIRALALYDYQAADNTEISFDPEDIIGCIQKVDPGWWHGKVVSGKYKGQIGLFPANYVQEITDE